MRLGFHYHIPAKSGKGNIYMPGYQGRFIDSLAAYCDQVVCFLHSPSHTDVPHWDYPLQSKNVELVDIGPHSSIPHRTLFSKRFSNPVREWKNKLDVLLIRGPTPLVFPMSKAISPQPIALLLTGDYRSRIHEEIPQPIWRKIMIRLWAEWNYRQQLQIAKHALTFTNSRKLYLDLESHVPNLIETRTTTLYEEDFFQRKDTCHSPPYHLLYTGRMTRAKGLFEMVEAVSLLINDGLEVILDMVGLPVANDPVLIEIASLAKKLGTEERIIYHGYRTFGPELFAFYQRADIYVIPSHFEGFPRTIWEAMAHCLPVIATKVGSIPDFIEGAAELIDPQNVQDLKTAILKIITNTDYRKSLINRGYSLALDNTSEQRAKEMTDEIKKFVIKHSY